MESEAWSFWRIYQDNSKRKTRLKERNRNKMEIKIWKYDAGFLWGKIRIEEINRRIKRGKFESN